MLNALTSFFLDIQALYVKRDLFDQFALLAALVGLFGTPAALVAAGWRIARRRWDGQRAAEQQERRALVDLVGKQESLINELKKRQSETEPSFPPLRWRALQHCNEPIGSLR